MAGGSDETLMHALCYSAGGAVAAGGVRLGGASSGRPPPSAESVMQQLSLLLHARASVDAMNGKGESALDVALFHAPIEMVDLLKSYGAKSSMTTADGGCLLHAAALQKRPDVLDAALSSLAKIGVDLNQQDRAGRTPLHVAVASGDPDLVFPLLKMKASTEVQADDGATPLRLAVSQGDLPITTMLLNDGADRNSLGADAVPLIVLATEVSVPVALALVRAGADLNQPDSNGRTALEVAVSRGEHELCELLLTKGARPTSRKDAAGNTSLHVAVHAKSEHLVRLLVRHKAELSEQNRRGQSPLILGAESGQASVVELLLHSGAPLHLCDTSNRSALELALQNGHLDVLKILLQQSIVDVNGITKRGSSLLHLAAEIGDETRITFLLSMQAQVRPPRAPSSLCSPTSHSRPISVRTSDPPLPTFSDCCSSPPFGALDTGGRAQPQRRDAPSLGVLSRPPRGRPRPRAVRRQRDAPRARAGPHATARGVRIARPASCASPPDPALRSDGVE